MKYLTVRAAAATLGVHENTLRRWEARGIVQAVRLPGSNFRRFLQEEIDRLAEEMSGSARPGQSTATGPRTDETVPRSAAPEGEPVAVRWPAPLDVLRRLIAVSEQHGEPMGSLIVLVGGSAMAAHGIRAESNDVDVYTPTASDDAISQVEAELRGTYGRTFRIDVTTVENIWGLIMIRDLARAPRVAQIVSPAGRRHVVRALSTEDLYVLKVASGRRRDNDDLPLIAARTTPTAVIARFNQLLPGIGDRGAIPAIVDALVGNLAAHYGVAPNETIARLAVSEGLREDIREAHA